MSSLGLYSLVQYQDQVMSGWPVSRRAIGSMSKPWWIDISDLRGRLAQSHEIDNSAGDTIGAWWKCRGPAESCPGEKADQGVTENYPRSNMRHPQYCKIQHGGKLSKTCGFTPILLLVMMVVAWIATLRCKYIQIPLPRTGKYCLQGAVPVPTPWVPPLRGWSPMGRAPNFPHCHPGLGDSA